MRASADSATERVAIGLGSNLDNPRQQVRRAFEELAQLPETVVQARSSLYRSAPMGPADQPDFINAVAILRTGLSPQGLLAQLQLIEQAHGRDRSVERWGPRSLDLDILLFGSRRLNEPGLTIPHRGFDERPFVLIPLAEIAADWPLGEGWTVGELAATMDPDGLTRLGQ